MHVFAYTGTSLIKKPSQVTLVHSTTRMSSQGQPSAYFRAEIERTASSKTTIEIDKELKKQQHTDELQQNSCLDKSDNSNLNFTSIISATPPWS